jgi:hypothetical protein
MKNPIFDNALIKRRGLLCFGLIYFQMFMQRQFFPNIKRFIYWK